MPKPLPMQPREEEQSLQTLWLRVICFRAASRLFVCHACGRSVCRRSIWLVAGLGISPSISERCKFLASLCLRFSCVPARQQAGNSLQVGSGSSEQFPSISVHVPELAVSDSGADAIAAETVKQDIQKKNAEVSRSLASVRERLEALALA